MANIFVIHGPNLNLLGTREPEHYGRATLADIDRHLQETANQSGHTLTSLQSNAESELIDSIHLAQDEDVAFIIINPAAFTHTSVALRDALAAVAIPFIEVHLSNVHAREAYRRKSMIAQACIGSINGFGASTYILGLEAAILHNKANH